MLASLLLALDPTPRRSRHWLGREGARRIPACPGCKQRPSRIDRSVSVVLWPIHRADARIGIGLFPIHSSHRAALWASLALWALDLTTALTRATLKASLALVRPLPARDPLARLPLNCLAHRNHRQRWEGLRTLHPIRVIESGQRNTTFRKPPTGLGAKHPALLVLVRDLAGFNGLQ